MEIGEEDRPMIVEPVEDPFRREEPTPAPSKPVKAPEKVPEKTPA